MITFRKTDGGKGDGALHLTEWHMKDGCQSLNCELAVIVEKPIGQKIKMVMRLICLQKLAQPCCGWLDGAGWGRTKLTD